MYSVKLEIGFSLSSPYYDSQEVEEEFGYENKEIFEIVIKYFW